ncbi:zinc ABC transporter substrate-binding protein [Phenylobacterium sp.]|uniref:metal ABC transporter solute-binding protein, Zn/Mn family n=1 Tax=Phenylobacterium sp. TaxID=1871053 RepID=UPI0025D96622|nr:zinc ABC transporter substrate-binding protein [Phenylobacterium sp.]
MRKAILGALGAALLATGAASPAAAALQVFACEPEWAALAHEIGGDKVSIYAATTGVQDPHLIQARPSLISKARTADLTVCTGAELEIGWLPMIVSQSANKKIAPGQRGVFQPTDYVKLLETPASLDRSQGDIHAGGNPHIQSDPRNMLPVGKALADRFAELDPANAATYRARYAAFATNWTAALKKWQTEAAPLRGVSIAVQHRSWVYLENWLGLHRVVALEPKPGVPPSSGYLAQVLEVLKKQPVKMIIRAAYEDERPSEFVGGRAGVPAVMLPYTIGGSDQAKDLHSLYDDTINRMLKALK